MIPFTNYCKLEMTILSAVFIYDNGQILLLYASISHGRNSNAIVCMFVCAYLCLCVCLLVLF